jgi:tetratricopeptide (TPR) repeat protein
MNYILDKQGASTLFSCILAIEMIKPLRLIATLSLILLNTPVVAQENPLCYLITSNRTAINLSKYCGGAKRDRMNAQEFLQQGFSHGKKERYQEAIADFTQAINLQPDFAEAYIARGYARYGAENTQEGIRDLQKAADIYRQRGDEYKLKVVLDLIQSFQNDPD